MSDAKLTEIDISQVAPTGLANLSKHGAEATYRFRSPTRSKRPRDVPNGVEVDIICMVYVEVKNGKASVYAVANETCDDRFPRKPRCSLAQVWNKAYKRGAPSGNWVAKINYANGWFISIRKAQRDGRDFDASLPDDC